MTEIAEVKRQAVYKLSDNKWFIEKKRKKDATLQLWHTIHILQKKCHTKDLLNNCWKVNGILYANEPAYTIITKKHQKEKERGMKNGKNLSY